MGSVVAAASGFQGQQSQQRCLGSSSVGCEQAETSSPQPWHLLDTHQRGFVEGFLTAEPLFVLVCVLRLPENSVGYPTLPSMIFFFFLFKSETVHFHP